MSFSVPEEKSMIYKRKREKKEGVVIRNDTGRLNE